jgi:hypothetical protein
MAAPSSLNLLGEIGLLSSLVYIIIYKVDDCGVCVCVCVCVVPKHVNIFQFWLRSDKNNRYFKREVARTSARVSTFLPPNSLNNRIYQK